MDRRILLEGGKVHDVGFRPFLFEKARMLRLERFVAENVYADGREVLIVSFGGGEKAVKEFAEFCRTARPKGAEVMRVREEKPPEDILPIGEYEGILASGQQRKIVVSGLEMLSMQRENLGIAKETLGLQKETVGYAKETLGLQIETVGLLRENSGKLDSFHRDTMQRFDAANYRFEKLLQELKDERLEARKSTERIIAMIAGMKSGGVVREKKAVYGAPKKGKKKG